MENYLFRQEIRTCGSATRYDVYVLLHNNNMYTNYATSFLCQQKSKGAKSTNQRSTALPDEWGGVGQVTNAVKYSYISYYLPG